MQKKELRTKQPWEISGRLGGNGKQNFQGAVAGTQSKHDQTIRCVACQSAYLSLVSELTLPDDNQK